MLYVGALIERDQVSVGIEDSELFGPPRLCLKRGVRVNNSVTLAQAVKRLNRSHLHPATRGFRNAPIGAGPEVNLNRAARNNAICARSDVNLLKAKLGGEELRTSLDIERGEKGNGGDELGRIAHATDLRRITRLCNNPIRKPREWRFGIDVGIHAARLL